MKLIKYLAPYTFNLLDVIYISDIIEDEILKNSYFEIGLKNCHKALVFKSDDKKQLEADRLSLINDIIPT